MALRQLIVIAVIAAIACEKARAQNACVNTLVTAGNGVLSADQINTLIDGHNTQRRSVNPYANAMPLLTWSAALATYAQQLVDACPSADATPTAQLTNQQGVALLGENYVRGDSNSFGLDGGAGGHAMLSWVESLSYWHYPSTCDAGHDCRPYMQVVDASATQFGCGYKQCGSSGPRHLWRCLFNHAQPSTSAPYATGGTANACQQGIIPTAPQPQGANSTPQPAAAVTPAPLPACELNAAATSGPALSACIQGIAMTAPTLGGKPMCSVAAVNISAVCVNAFALVNKDCPTALKRSQEFALGKTTCTDANSQGALQVKATCAEGEAGYSLLCQITQVPSAASAVATSAVLMAVAMVSFVF